MSARISQSDFWSRSPPSNVKPAESSCVEALPRPPNRSRIGYDRLDADCNIHGHINVA